MWFKMPGVQIPSATPYVTPTRTEAIPVHGLCGSFSLESKDPVEISSEEMLEYIHYIRKHSRIHPRTYWVEFPFYFALDNHKKQICFGYRPEDFEYIEILNKRALRKHRAYLNRLDRFPLDKAELYLRLKESHGVSSVRGLSKITGEDWSYIARILRILSLPEAIKDFLRNNKNDPAIVRLFTFRRLLDIVRQGETALQLSCFREFVEQNGLNPVIS